MTAAHPLIPYVSSYSLEVLLQCPDQFLETVSGGEGYACDWLDRNKADLLELLPPLVLVAEHDRRRQMPERQQELVHRRVLHHHLIRRERRLFVDANPRDRDGDGLGCRIWFSVGQTCLLSAAGRPPYSVNDPPRRPSRVLLAEPFALPPLVLVQEHGPKLGEPFGGVSSEARMTARSSIVSARSATPSGGRARAGRQLVGADRPDVPASSATADRPRVRRRASPSEPTPR